MLQAGSRMTNGGTAPAISHKQMSIADMIKYFHDRDKFRLATSKAAMKEWNFDINMFPSQSAYSKVRARYQRGYEFVAEVMSETEFQQLKKADKGNRVVVEWVNSIQQRAQKTTKKVCKKRQK